MCACYTNIICGFRLCLQQREGAFVRRTNGYWLPSRQRGTGFVGVVYLASWPGPRQTLRIQARAPQVLEMAPVNPCVAIGSIRYGRQQNARFRDRSEVVLSRRIRALPSGNDH